MVDKLYVVKINGQLYQRGSMLRTYRTLESAQANTHRWVRTGSTVEIGELSLVNVTEYKEDAK